MAYERQNFKNGQVLTAAHLNHMENGIASASKLTDSELEMIVELVIDEISERLNMKL